MKAHRLVALAGSLVAAPVAFATSVRAHCPLCTVGAGGAAAIATALGVGLSIVGVFIGAFGIATGLWMTGFLEREFVRYQDQLLTIGIALTIVLPVLPLMNESVPIFLSIAGEYGSLLNRTYLVNTYLVGTVIGGALTYGTPVLSAKITEARGRTVPFQGLVLTFLLLFAAAGILEVLL